MVKPPVIENSDQLIALLKADFAYCGCGFYEEAIFVLRDVLQLAQDRQDALHNPDAGRCAHVKREIEAWMRNSPGLATWFLWLLDERDFIWHGTSASDCWITPKGSAVLQAIKDFYPRQEMRASDT